MSTTAVVAAGACLRPPHSAPDWFDGRAELGRGYRHLPDASLYLLAAARNAGVAVAESDPERWGVVVASESGSCRLHDAIDESVIGGEAHLISPTLAPHFAHNLIASRLAMEYRLTGFCLSVHTPVSAGLDALSLALTAIASRRADRVVVGAVEAPRRRDGTLPEGAIVLTLDAIGQGGAAPMASVDIHRSRPGDLARTLTAVHADGPIVLVAAKAAERTAAHELAAELRGVADVRVTDATGALSTFEPLTDLITSSRPGGSVVAMTDSIAVVATVHPGVPESIRSTNTQQKEYVCPSPP